MSVLHPYYFYMVLWNLAPSVPFNIKEIILFKDSENAGELPASFEVAGTYSATVDTDDSGASHMASDQVTNEMETCR
jgi:hypothetical protein